MDANASPTRAARTIALYPWFKFCQNLVFWQAVWFLYFQQELSAAEAILLYAVYDIGTTVLEVPSGYMSDRLGRRLTLIASAVAGLTGVLLLGIGGGFAVFVLAQLCLGASSAFASGTDSALLYESLVEAGREDEIERQELRAWRFSFVALALSAVTGGAMAMEAYSLPFLASAVAHVGFLAVALAFAEPEHRDDAPPHGGELVRLGSLRAALTEPVLIWLFALTVLMYGYSHLPFIFGQPFILEALAGTGLEPEVPLVSGAVSALMMLLSVATSLVAPALRRRIGLAAILLLAFGMQIALIGTLTLTDSAIAIALLFLRMVPNSLSRPFIIARIQPVLSRDSRATYLSLQSFAARVLFAATLFLASLSASSAGAMPYLEIQQVLGWYTLGGLACFAALALAARRLGIDPGRR